MKELYNEFFHVSKDGKVREKVMLMRTAITVIVIIICLFAMSFSAYAYFSHSITSGLNVIKAANFEAKITVTASVGENPTLEAVDGKTYSAKLKPGVTYTFTVEKGGTAETGFCVITAVGCDQTYHTQQLGKDISAPNDSTSKITFDLMVSDNTTVYVVSHWGTSSYYSAYQNKGTAGELYITDANKGTDAVKLIIGGTSFISNEPDEENGSTDENKGGDNTTNPDENVGGNN